MFAIRFAKFGFVSFLTQNRHTVKIVCYHFDFNKKTIYSNNNFYGSFSLNFSLLSKTSNSLWEVKMVRCIWKRTYFACTEHLTARMYHKRSETNTHIHEHKILLRMCVSVSVWDIGQYKRTLESLCTTEVFLWCNWCQCEKNRRSVRRHMRCNVSQFGPCIFGCLGVFVSVDVNTRTIFFLLLWRSSPITSCFVRMWQQ